ncbi:hypothetical protein [Taibaiella chishuiensis]|uniref:Uncharacterized protein n=1 Tax=Taibaiella chishuiensis TaxID=1434707 RepID=A0A2P8DCP5_9BACT|nr:hypothetical protein [Taibaiella chishuiensis]PSK95001.1 hypothetical protein B0I18_1011165 [Taibaiella chishuiensis]
MSKQITGLFLSVLLLAYSAGAQVTVSGTVFHDPDGGPVNHSSNGPNTVPSGLYVYQLSSYAGQAMQIKALAPVNTDGTYTITAPAIITYNYICISTTVAQVGQFVQPALPAGWVFTGNNYPNGLYPLGFSNIGTPSNGSTLSDVNFGIEQLPQADHKTFAISTAALGNNAPAGGFPAVTISGIPYNWIAMNTPALTGYPTGGSLSGSDPEDCAAASSCNLNRNFVIATIGVNTALYYNFGGTTGIRAVVAQDTLKQFDPGKLMMYMAGNATGMSFTYRLQDAAGKNSAPATYTVTAALPLSVKAYLRGAWGGTRHKDVTPAWASVLSANALTQPYNTAAFGNYAGTESVTAATFTASPSDDNDIVDWVLLELKKADGSLVDRHAAFILENGNVVGTDKVSPVYFKAPPGSYHLTIRHRNHLGLSTELITLPAAGAGFDFSTATDATLFGTSDAYTTANGKVCLIAGNANSNGNVRYNSTANDRDAILAYLGFDEVGYNQQVYTPADVNLDGNVRYNGLGNDRDFLLEMLGFNEIGFVAEQVK